MSKLYTLLFLSLASIFSLSAHETDDTLRIQSIEEVTIIGSPKENSPLRQQSMSSTLLTGSQLKERQIVSLKGISQIAPNFFMPDYGSRLTSAIYIRGIGSRINNPAVGLYVDNIPFNDKSAFDFNLNDIERIEVLRGPQGTLYGRNTMGGLIKAYTRSPLTYTGTDIHLGYATGDNHFTGSFTHYHHPSDKFAWYVGGYYEGSDGFFTNDMTGRKVDDMQSVGGRFRALYLPTDRLKFDFNVNYDFNDEGAYPYFYQGTNTHGLLAEPIGHLDQIIANRESCYKRSVVNIGLNTQYEADRFTLSNMTGFQGLHDRMFMDQDFIHYDIFTLEQKQKLATISDELTLKSKGNSRWNWVSGANVMYQSLNTTGPVTFMSDGISFLESTINGYMPEISVMGMPMPMGIKINDQQIMMGGDFDTPVLNAALFHQSEISLTDALKLTLGLRIDYEHNSLDYDAPGSVNYDFTMTSQMMPINLKGLLANPNFRGSISNDYIQLMPKFALQYDFSGKSNIYATVSRGTRSGGYNVQMFNDLLQGDMRNIMMSQVKEGTAEAIRKIAAENPRMPQSVVNMIIGNLDKIPVGETPDVTETITYKPEYSWNYEVGTHLSTADNRYQADAAVFFIDTQDQQIARFAESGLGRMMVNAGHSQSRGAELSLRGELVRNLNIALNYGYTYAKFKDYDGGIDNDYSGNYVPFVPKHTVSLDASYSWYFNSSWANRLTIGATYSGAGRIYWTESNYFSQKYYSLLGARATLHTKYAQIELWSRNLTDTKYDTFYFESMSRGFAQKGKPSQIGIDLRFHF